MTPAELKKSWATTLAYLEEARKLIPNSPDTSRVVQQYNEWLEHNELELALDELESVVEIVDCPVQFWIALREAARNMRLDGRADEFNRILENKFP